MIPLRSLLTLLPLALLTACQPAHVHVHQSPGPNPWTSLALNNNPDEFQFAVVADRTGQHRDGVFENALLKLNLLQPEFVVSVGDLIEGYTEDDAQLDKQWAEIQAAIAKLEMPFFFIPGNHDISNPTQLKHWNRRFGRPYYYFVYKNVLFLCLNTEDPFATLGKEQIAYFRKTLADNKNVRWTLVFMHQPLWTHTRNTGWPDVEKALAGRNYTVIVGHNHAYQKFTRNESKYFILATTGGGMSGELTGPKLGTFDHVTWVTMKKSGPEFAHIEPDHIHDENVRTEAGATVINPIVRGQVIRPDPIFSTDANFTAAPTRLRIANPNEIPLRIKGAFQPHDHLKPNPAAIDLTIPPRAEQLVDLTVTADQPRPVNDLAPLILNWTASFQLPNEGPSEIPMTTTLAVTRRLDCKPAAKPITVDANLEDWPALTRTGPDPKPWPNATQWKGPADFSWKYDVAYDDKFLYVAVNVKDDIPISNPRATPWDQDGIELRLDARPEPERSLSRGLKEGVNHLNIAISPGESPDKPTVNEPEKIDKSVQYAIRRTPEGFAAEFAIPVAYLNDKQKEPWKAFRLNLIVNDKDDKLGAIKRALSTPDWRKKDNIAGSGTFDKK